MSFTSTVGSGTRGFCDLWAFEEATGEQQECAGWVEAVPGVSED